MSEVKYKAVPATSLNCEGCCFYNDETGDCLDLKGEKTKSLKKCADGYIYQLDTPTVTLEQAREKFENKYGHLAETLDKEETGEYVDKDFQFTWIGYKWSLKDFNILEEGE